LLSFGHEVCFRDTANRQCLASKSEEKFYKSLGIVTDGHGLLDSGELVPKELKCSDLNGKDGKSGAYSRKKGYNTNSLL
jgi:hypothetical protein